MKKKAYLVTIAPMVRVIADSNATEEQVIELAVEKMRSNPEEYLHATHCEDVKEDTECPCNPERDGGSKVEKLVEAYFDLTCAEKDEFLRLTDNQ